MDDFRREQNKAVGVGGIHCYCCNDYHGKNKPVLNRLVRRRIKQKDKSADVEWEASFDNPAEKESS